MQTIEKKQRKKIMLLSLLTAIPASATVAIVNSGDTVFWTNVDRALEGGKEKVFEVAGKSFLLAPIVLAQGDGDGDGYGDSYSYTPSCDSYSGDGDGDGGSDSC